MGVGVYEPMDEWQSTLPQSDISGDLRDKGLVSSVALGLSLSRGLVETSVT